MQKLRALEALRLHVIAKLKLGWSPQQIARRLKQVAADEAVSHETNYQIVYGTEGSKAGLYACLMRAGRKRRRRFGRKPRQSSIPHTLGIACRPAEVAAREAFGHWEGDLMMFAKELGKANVTSLLERTSRYAILLPNPDRRSAAVIGGIREVLGGLPEQARRTITFDRGTAFMAYPTLARELGMQSYFCDPHSPWQKGAVENSNGRLRRYLPHDVDPAGREGVSLQKLADRLNDTPRRCLGYRTPREVFTDHVTPLPGQSYTHPELSHFA